MLRKDTGILDLVDVASGYLVFIRLSPSLAEKVLSN